MDEVTQYKYFVNLQNYRTFTRAILQNDPNCLKKRYPYPKKVFYLVLTLKPRV